TFLIVGVSCVLLAIVLFAGRFVIQSSRERLLALGQDYVLTHAPGRQFGSYPEWLKARVPRFLDHYKVSNPAFGIPIACGTAAMLLWFAFQRGTLRRRT